MDDEEDIKLPVMSQHLIEFTNQWEARAKIGETSSLTTSERSLLGIFSMWLAKRIKVQNHQEIE